jgi:tetratricopeptide (TPR) repeat protein
MSDFEKLEEMPEQELWDSLSLVSGIEKADTLYVLSKKLHSRKLFQESLTLAEQARDIYLEHKNLVNESSLTNAYLAVGFNADELNQNQIAIDNYNKALEIFIQSNRSDQVYWLAAILARNYELEKMQEKRLELINNMVQVGLTLTLLEKYEEAYETFKTAREIALSNGSNYQMIETYFHLAIGLFNVDKLEESIDAFKSVEDVAVLYSKPLFEAKCKLWIARCLRQMNKSSEAKTTFLESKEIVVKNNLQDCDDILIIIEREYASCLESMSDPISQDVLTKQKKLLASYDKVIHKI